MKYTARDQSRVENIAPSAIFVTRLSSRAVYFIQTKQQCFKCFIVFYTYHSVNKTHLLNKQIVFFDKMCQ